MPRHFRTGMEQFAIQEMGREWAPPRTVQTATAGTGWTILGGPIRFGAPTWRHTKSGRVVVGVKTQVPGQPLGIYQYINPEASYLGTSWIGGDRLRKKRYWKTAASLISGPGVLGLLTGLGLPSLLSGSALFGTSLGIGIAGYLAPTGSFIKRFSVGAAIGGGLHLGLKYGPKISAIVGRVDQALAFGGGLKGFAALAWDLAPLGMPVTPGSMRRWAGRARRYTQWRERVEFNREFDMDMIYM